MHRKLSSEAEGLPTYGMTTGGCTRACIGKAEETLWSLEAKTSYGTTTLNHTGARTAQKTQFYAGKRMNSTTKEVKKYD